MSFTLFKATAKANWLIGMIILAVMLMYLSIIISMFDPNAINALTAMLETLPDELVKALGYDTIATNLTGFIAGYYYGFIVPVFPMIYCIIVPNRLVAEHVDSGSMAYLLATPNTRVKIITTQAVYMLSTTAVLFALVTAAGIAISELLFPGELVSGNFLSLNFSALLTLFTVSSISFLFSCIFNDTRNSLIFGAGIPIIFFVIDMLANVSADLAWIGNLSLFTLFKPTTIAAGESSTGLANLILVIITLLLYAGSIFIFKRRSLPL